MTDNNIPSGEEFRPWPSSASGAGLPAPAAKEIETTLVVSITTKIDMKGRYHTADELIGEATFEALQRIDQALEAAGETTIRTKGATTLVERSVLNSWFEEER